MDFKYLKLSSSNSAILDVKFAHPPANAVDVEMYIEIATLFSQPHKVAANALAIVLSAEGPHFCAGKGFDEFVTMTPENR